MGAFGTPHVKALKRIGPHPSIIVDYLIGILLSDGSLHKSGRGFFVRLQQSMRHEDFFKSVHAVFYQHGYCSALGKPLSRTDCLGATPEKPAVYRVMYTYTFASFDWIYQLFFGPNGVKGIYPALEAYLNARVLAIWICGDGSFQRDGVELCTDGFSVVEVELLCSMLGNVFGLRAGVKYTEKGNPRIRIYKDSVDRLILLVKDYMPASMHYKLGINNPSKRS
jgi:hypothetical protein